MRSWLLALLLIGGVVIPAQAADTTISPNTSVVPTSAPLDSDTAGQSGAIAIQSVMRVVCAQQNKMGTGFLHKSGKVITAAHVVAGCPQLILVLSNGSQISATVFAADAAHDLALISPSHPINAPALPISANGNYAIGAQVSTWGFPGGYAGLMPLLGVGYLSGIQGQKLPSGEIVRQWVVNAAFNSGNSGGPLILVETSEVIGIVSSKLAPVSPQTAQILEALEKRSSGFVFGTATLPDGTSKTVLESQAIAAVLEDLRAQVQLVIGMAATADDIRSFLRAQHIDP